MEKKNLLTDTDVLNALRLIYQTKDREGLWVFISDVFGVRIPRKQICKDHNAPFDFICAVFFEEHPSIIALANRSGGKTLNYSILDTLNSHVHDGCETASAGAIEEQARKCYRYFQGWNGRIKVFAKRVVSSLMSETKFTNGSLLQIITGTQKGLNSPHPQKAFLDEVELMAWGVLMEAFSMAQTKSLYNKQGIKTGEIIGQTIITSTRKYAYGTMERLIKEAGQRGFKVFQWCILETIEKHDPAVCALTPFDEDCQQRCTEYEGFYSFNDTVANRKRLDRDTWDAQWRCLKPSAKGLVYPQFNPLLHVKKLTPDTGSKVILAEDFGFAEGHANVIGFWQVTPSGIKQMIAELYIEGMVDDELVWEMENKLIELGFIAPKYVTYDKQQRKEFRQFYVAKVEDWYCPPEEPSKIAIRESYGYRITTQNDPEIRKVTFGIPLVRKDLEDGLLVFDESCIGTIGEMGMYPNKERPDGTFLNEPQKKHDNGPDMIRYFYINAYPYPPQVQRVEPRREEGNETILAGIMDMEF